MFGTRSIDTVYRCVHTTLVVRSVCGRVIRVMVGIVVACQTMNRMVFCLLSVYCRPVVGMGSCCGRDCRPNVGQHVSVSMV